MRLLPNPSDERKAGLSVLSRWERRTIHPALTPPPISPGCLTGYQGQDYSYPDQ